MKREAFKAGLAILTLCLAVGCDRGTNEARKEVRAEGYADEQLVADVQQELTASGKIDSEAVAVRAEEGVVTLSGEVRSEDERARAEAAAKKIAGVQRVDNEIVIAGQQPQAQSED
jgi:osmotically-inducible protein OsmY